MTDKVERALEPDGAVIPWLYVRHYRNSKNRAVTKYYAIFTDWSGRRRRLPLGDELKARR